MYHITSIIIDCNNLYVYLKCRYQSNGCDTGVKFINGTYMYNAIGPCCVEVS